jgi:tetratricopeptide (TPR) repeat protein
MSTKSDRKKPSDLKLARAAKANGNYEKARDLFEKEYQNGNHSVEILSNLAFMNYNLSELETAYRYACELVALVPTDMNTGLLISVLLMRLGRLDEARTLLAEMREMHPDRIEVLHNLHSVASQSKQHQEAAQIAMSAIEMNPKDASAYNNLGASLNALGLYAQAKAAFEVVTALDPGHVTALTNLALINSGDGQIHEGIQLLEQALEIVRERRDEPNIQAVQHNLGFQYLRAGRLAEGWRYLESGFSAHIDRSRGRRPQRGFTQPRWTGQPLNGKTLMVWREQGLGDEILFATCLKELDAVDGKVIVECEMRLIETWSRSFPKFIFRPEAYYNNTKLMAYHSDFDYQIPIGSLCGIYRTKITDFDRSGPFVVANPERVLEFVRRLDQAIERKEEKLLVGICWRSGIIEPHRNNEYTLLSDWGPLFSLPNIEFVNLQYGPCEDELLEAEREWGIRIHRWPDLNLQNDLDGVFALMKCLDTVVTVQTSVNTMAGVVGLPVKTITPYLGGWPNFGTERYPFFPNTKVYFSDKGQQVIQTLPAIAKDLKQMCDDKIFENMPAAEVT